MDIMNFLSIDCSTDIGSLFVKIENKTFSKNLQNNKSNNDSLMKQIMDFFTENNLEFDEISEIFVNQGPGNFSGLRGSLATAKGISLSKNIKLFGYNTFIWSCARFIKKKDYVYSFIKFKERCFVKKYGQNLNVTSKIEEITEEDIVKKYNDKFKVIVKSATQCFKDEVLKLNNINIIDLDHKELELLKLNDLLDKDLIKPLYLS